MSSKSTEGDDPGPSPATVLILSIADTTWRMFLPIVGLLLLGRAADDAWHTGHLWMAIGTIVGIVISGLLIKQQLERKV